MDKLSRRIGELHKETDEVRTELQALHKERVRLEKEREIQQGEINRWSEKITEVQMTKFGRLVDLDELDQEADRSKEEETAEMIEKLQKKHDILVAKLLLQKDKVKDSIAEVRVDDLLMNFELVSIAFAVLLLRYGRFVYDVPGFVL